MKTTGFLVKAFLLPPAETRAQEKRYRRAFLNAARGFARAVATRQNGTVDLAHAALVQQALHECAYEVFTTRIPDRGIDSLSNKDLIFKPRCATRLAMLPMDTLQEKDAVHFNVWKKIALPSTKEGPYIPKADGGCLYVKTRCRVFMAHKRGSQPAAEVLAGTRFDRRRISSLRREGDLLAGLDPDVWDGVPAELRGKLRAAGCHP